MSATFSTIVSKIRHLLSENSTSGKDFFTFESSKVFTIGDLNVQTITAVLKNGAEVSESGNWEYSSTTNKLTFESSYSINVGDVIEVQYTYYPNYSDAELDSYTRASLIHISANQYKTFFVANDKITPTPSEDEENLIALIASILIRPDNRNYKLPDISIQVPLNSSTTSELIKHTVARFKKSSGGLFKIIYQ